MMAQNIIACEGGQLSIMMIRGSSGGKSIEIMESFTGSMDPLQLFAGSVERLSHIGFMETFKGKLTMLKYYEEYYESVELIK